MKKSIVSSVTIFIFILFYNPNYGQEAGISFGNSVFPPAFLEQSYSYYDLVPMDPIYSIAAAPAKELMFHFSYYLNSNVRLDFSTGYGFGNTKKEWKTVYTNQTQGSEMVLTNSKELDTDGFPGLIELQFFAPLNESGTLVPFMGIGVGYCSYKTKVSDKSSSLTTKTDLSTKGFGQYVSAGLSIKFMERASVFFQMQKILISSVKTEKSNPVRFPPDAGIPIETSSIEQPVKPGLGDIGLSAGVRFYMGKQ
ncbi:MAG: hypothetical protein ACM3UR_03565 [Bacteroidota bacterium]|jgi:outer membrane protein W|nr:hypothetical protein [Ignavibacteria bacterium]MCU7498756.1 hypothetical protein [Ignavibacteria bacterium]MCU7512050.1 hypothetical protein [Ignavibacteria bacterium]MCU7520583.1 hypothetical protein [Ignavibacteria bacterium]MCU7523481.1 hypothetical protein [Ignavibacteria bacterium]